MSSPCLCLVSPVLFCRFANELLTLLPTSPVLLPDPFLLVLTSRLSLPWLVAPSFVYGNVPFVCSLSLFHLLFTFFLLRPIFSSHFFSFTLLTYTFTTILPNKRLTLSLLSLLIFCFICFSFLSFFLQSSAPELCSLWNPSLRKTLSHPSAVHKGKEFCKSKLAPSSLGSTSTSKSVRVSNKVKEKNKPGSAPPSAECPADVPRTERRKSPLAAVSVTSSGLNHTSERNLVSPSKLTKKSFIDGFKNSLKMKRTDFLSELQPSSSSLSNSSHSFDAATIKKSSLTNEYLLTRVNNSIRRWSESAPRNAKNNES